MVYCGSIRLPVSLLFPHSCFTQLASDANINHATRLTTLLLKQPIFFFFLGGIYHSETKYFELQNYVSHVLIQCQKRIHAVGPDT